MTVQCATYTSGSINKNKFLNVAHVWPNWPSARFTLRFTWKNTYQVFVSKFQTGLLNRGCFWCRLTGMVSYYLQVLFVKCWLTTNLEYLKNNSECFRQWQTMINSLGSVQKNVFRIFRQIWHMFRGKKAAGKNWQKFYNEKTFHKFFLDHPPNISEDPKKGL